MNFVRNIFLLIASLSVNYVMCFDDLPNQTLIDGIVHNIHPHQLCKQTESSLFIKSNALYAYLAGELNESELQEIAAQLSTYDEVTLICEEKFHTFFLEHGYSLQPRIEFEFSLENKKNAIECPVGCAIVPIKTIELFKKCLRFDFISKLYGSSEHFLNTGFGFALVDDQGNPLAEAHAALLSNKACEISVITHPEHRSKGFSTLVVHHMISECLKRGLQPHWSCNADNAASRSVAHKSGFTIKRYYAQLKRTMN